MPSKSAIKQSERKANAGELNRARSLKKPLIGDPIVAKMFEK